MLFRSTYKIVISPTSAGIPISANSIKGIQFEIVVPAGLTVRYDPASGETLSGIVTLSASVPADRISYSTFSTSTNVLSFGLISSKGMGAGDLATFICDIVPGWTVPSASALRVRNSKAVDGNANTLGNVTVNVN